MTTKQATAIVDGWLKADSGRFDTLALAYIVGPDGRGQPRKTGEDDDAALFSD